MSRSLAAVLTTVAASAYAGVGMVELPASAVSGPVTVFYPAQAVPGVVRIDRLAQTPAFAGSSVALTGSVLDGVKKVIVSAVNDRKFDDASWYQHVDNRIVAVAAGVPHPPRDRPPWPPASIT